MLMQKMATNSPARGEQQWATDDTMVSILPPIFRRPLGRPHKKREREADEAPPMTGKLRRPGTKTTPTTSQDTTTQTPSSTSTEPSHPNVFRWIPHPEYLLVKTIVAITYLQVQHQHLLVKTIVTVNHLQGLILDYGGTRILLRTQ
ncbi:hypothetical protein V6N11_070707 [Hibiscus sabdariffa]|uniref:Uncharacterized protein n=1 Tax=Hibiscus sabdariffa TaxID=183260 RepID=A0ABR2QFT5_9ROSI